MRSVGFDRVERNLTEAGNQPNWAPVSAGRYFRAALLRRVLFSIWLTAGRPRNGEGSRRHARKPRGAGSRGEGQRARDISSPHAVRDFLCTSRNGRRGSLQIASGVSFLG
jgi:hypothetical protein